MNSLNSVLIEGNVKGEVVQSLKEIPQAEFKIVSTLFYKEDPSIHNSAVYVKKESTFCVETFGMLALHCVEDLTDGRGVRVVGRLRQRKDGSVIIVAEHVEFKPKLN